VRETDFGPTTDIPELLMAYSGENEHPAAQRPRPRRDGHEENGRVPASRIAVGEEAFVGDPEHVA
jgi:hypothetical protein